MNESWRLPPFVGGSGDGHRSLFGGDGHRFSRHSGSWFGRVDELLILTTSEVIADLPASNKISME